MKIQEPDKIIFTVEMARHIEVNKARKTMSSGVSPQLFVISCYPSP